MEGGGSATELTQVAFVRQLPMMCSERDLEALGAGYGKVVAVMKVEGKRIGFIEFETVEECLHAIESSAQNPPAIRGQVVEIKKSGRARITRPTPGTGMVLLVTVGPSPRSTQTPPLDTLPDTLYTFFGSVTRSVVRIACFEKAGQVQGLVEFTSPEEASQAKLILEGSPLPSGHPVKIQHANTVAPLKINFQNTKSRDFSGMLHQNNGGQMYPTQPNQPGVVAAGRDPHGDAGNVVLVSRLPDGKGVMPSHLFKLFSTCGDVMRIKILYTKRDSALVQFRESWQAKTARQHLNGICLFGSKVVVSASKQKEVTIPQAGSSPEAFELTRDYSDSLLHRFRVPNSKNFRHIVPPSHLLHISNIPEGVDDDLIKELLSKYGTLCSYHSFKHDKKMGIATMDSPDDAVSVLIHLHATPIPTHPSSKLMVSFSDSRSRQNVAQPPPQTQHPPVMQQPIMLNTMPGGYPPQQPVMQPAPGYVVH
eukprot:TRINITY_DN20234_c0_g1_i1.p1 TRINITY_DN20234_c0_g1~~TRINITY_DN20234_c0_g1_i1.p1  ORF type:complete len:492 (+),score=95.90 TRINITY_DN20234_c0_g1_i1:40-1476(+)